MHETYRTVFSQGIQGQGCPALGYINGHEDFLRDISESEDSLSKGKYKDRGIKR